MPQRYIVLVTIILIAYAIRMWGVQADLPLALGLDEPLRVRVTLYTATTGDLDHGYFNHPSSTVIYPLAMIYHGWGVISYDGQFFQANSAIRNAYYKDWTPFILLGRWLTISFALLTIPLVYQIGQRIFNQRIGLAGAWLSTLPLISKSYAQIIRDDIAATFFGLLTLYSLLSLYHSPTISNQIKSGVAIGASIATRYFMGLLVPVYWITLVLIWIRFSKGGLVSKTASLSQTTSFQTSPWRVILPGAIVAGFTTCLTFMITTPYFFINFDQVLTDLANENRTEHLGADGLSPIGNFVWYLTDAIPMSLTWPIYILAFIGLGVAVYRLQPATVIVASFVLIFWVGISLPALHWQRWLIPILPLWALFAASGLMIIIKKLPLNVPKSQLWLLALVTISLWPSYHLVLDGTRLMGNNTRTLARHWVFENIPPDAHLATEAYTAFFRNQSRYQIKTSFSLAQLEGSLDQAYHQDIRYVLVSSEIYNRIYAEPERYGTQIERYETLFANEILVKEFVPGYLERGPTIRIYQLRER